MRGHNYCCGNDDKCNGGCDCFCHSLKAENARLREALEKIATLDFEAGTDGDMLIKAYDCARLAINSGTQS